jgi:hypothetical protein
MVSFRCPNAGLQGQGALVVGVRSQAARGGGVYTLLFPRTTLLLVDLVVSHGVCFAAAGYQKEGGIAEEW